MRCLLKKFVLNKTFLIIKTKIKNWVFITIRIKKGHRRLMENEFFIALVFCFYCKIICIPVIIILSKIRTNLYVSYKTTEYDLTLKEVRIVYDLFWFVRTINDHCMNSKNFIWSPTTLRSTLKKQSSSTTRFNKMCFDYISSTSLFLKFSFRLLGDIRLQLCFA